MPPKTKELHTLLRDMPVEDQLGALLFAIVAITSDPLNVSLRLLNAIHVLSRQQSGENRFKISCALRDVADRLEQPAVNVSDAREIH